MYVQSKQWRQTHLHPFHYKRTRASTSEGVESPHTPTQARLATITPAGRESSISADEKPEEKEEELCVCVCVWSGKESTHVVHINSWNNIMYSHERYPI